jgi:hypothetical protein
MSATIIERQENSVTIQVTIPLSRSMLDTEEAIQQALNQAGVLATAEALGQFDTDGSPLLFGPSRFTSKGQEPKTYQTPYGEATVCRHVYQTGEGGATFCPLERDARIILTSTTTPAPTWVGWPGRSSLAARWPERSGCRIAATN